MIHITLPDMRVMKYDSPVNGLKIANDISMSLGKAAIAIEIDGKLCDLNTQISKDASVKIVTATGPEGLEVIRHSTAHVLAQAIKNLFPETQITIGPVIENGFYYDVLPKTSLTEEDLAKIEKEMVRIASQNYEVSRELWKRDDAIKFFKSIGENYKAEIIESIPEGEELSLYKQGEFIDLCRGPHVPSTKFVKHFKLTKLAGAYWRGDSKNAMLQRIYGTAWNTKEELDNYIRMLEEAEKRDHRKLGRQLELFHMQEEAQGMVFWHPNGWTIYRTLENLIREKLAEHDYIEVKTPMLLDKSLWEKSGHWEKFRENMFVVPEDDKNSMALKPMNCPCHIEIFKIGIKSYKDLPIRMAEFGSCHRNESSGALHGLMRVRNFTQDDAHIFCTEDQITSEAVAFIKLLYQVYKEFGFEDIIIKLSTRPEKRAGSDEVWDKAEEGLKTAMDSLGIKYTINPGEGAFYGPKIEFTLKDAIGREWQCGTLQLDFVLPERLQAHYIDEHGKKQHPVMLHRAVLGTIERFMGMLIEHYEGKFPFWLAPVQVAALTITTDVESYAKKVVKDLKDIGIRAILDNENDKINYKIRKHSLQKIPILIIIGKEEQANNKVGVRELGSNETQFYDLSELHGVLVTKNKRGVL